MHPEILIEKILLGITLAMPIGPVSVEMIKRGLSEGFWAAFKVRLGGAVGNTLCLVVSYFSLAILLEYPLIINSIALTGAIYLMFMGIKNALKKSVNLEKDNKSLFNIERSAVLIGFILSLANPISIVFWLGIFAASMGVQEVGLLNFINNMFIIVGVLIWGVLLSLALGVGKNYLNSTTVLIVNRVAGAVLFCFGLKYTWLNIEKMFL